MNANNNHKITTVHLTQEHYQFIKNSPYSLSKIVRNSIDELMKADPAKLPTPTGPDSTGKRRNDKG